MSVRIAAEHAVVTVDQFTVSISNKKHLLVACALGPGRSKRKVNSIMIPGGEVVGGFVGNTNHEGQWGLQVREASYPGRRLPSRADGALSVRRPGVALVKTLSSAYWTLRPTKC
jgi:hypothetical protein